MARNNLTPNERTLVARMGGLAKSKRHAGPVSTQAARDGFHARFEHEVDPNNLLTPEERQRAAYAAMREHMTRLAYKRGKTQRRKQGRS